MAMEEPLYNCRVFKLLDGGDQQGWKPKPTDLFGLLFSVGYEFYSTTSPGDVLRCQEIHGTPSLTIPCQNFFGQDGEDYLHTYLPQLPHFFTHERIHRMIPRIRREVQRVFGIPDEDVKMMTSTTNNVDYSNSWAEVVPFVLEFEFEVHFDFVEETASGGVEFEPTSHDEMVPAAEEAILKMLKKPKDVERDEQHYCTICMEGFDDDDDDDVNSGGLDDEDVSACAMPCDHVFHRQCIVQWLRISHVCPVCRYAMPAMTIIDDYEDEDNDSSREA